MHHPSGGSGYYSADYYGARDPYRRSLRGSGEHPLNRYLTIGIAAAGAAAYLLGYALESPGEGAGWPVRFALLAGLIAGFGLIPRQSGHPMVTAGFAAAGFLEGLSVRITGPDLAPAGWALTAIVVLNGLQAVAALVVLFTGDHGGRPESGDPGYGAYAEYYQRALAEYYAQYGQQESAEAQTAGGAATARQVADQRIAAPAEAAGANPYTDYVGTVAPAQAPAPAGPNAAAGPAAGLPNVGQSGHTAPAQPSRPAPGQQVSPWQ